MIKQKGFTLLEVTLAIALLATMTVFIAQATQKAIDAKVKTENELDRLIELREAIGVMSRDISMAFNYRDINIELHNAAVRARTQNKTPGEAQGQTPLPPASPTPPFVPNQQDTFWQNKEDIIFTQFIGSENELNFSSLSYVRTEENEFASDQAEIGYLIKTCKSRADTKKSYPCLWRRVSPFVDLEIKRGGTESVILENVTSLSFRYIGPGFTEEWIRNWASDGTVSTEMQGNFPFAVEISLEITDDKVKPPRKIAMTAVAPLRFPNNPPPPQGAQNAQAQ